MPPVTCSGTDIESNSVEFIPGTVGSGVNDMEESLNRDPPFEQSVTLPRTDVNTAK